MEEWRGPARLSGMRLVLYFHPYDIDSYRLVKELMRLKITSKIDIIPALEVEPREEAVIWSVPSIYNYSGEPLAYSPIDTRELLAIMRGEWRKTSYIHSDRDRFISTVLKSPIASALALVHGSYKPLIVSCSFLNGALRLKLWEASCKEVSKQLLEVSDDMFKESWRTAAIGLAYNYVRDYYIGNGFYGDPLDLERVNNRIIAAWLLAKASVGKAGIPLRSPNNEYLDYIAGYINNMAEKILDTVEYEFSTMITDRKYREEVEKEVRWFLPHYAES